MCPYQNINILVPYNCLHNHCTVQVYIYGGGLYMCVYMCGCGNQTTNLSAIPWELFTIFLRQDLLLAWCLPHRLDCLASESQVVSFNIPMPITEIKCHTTMSGTFTWFQTYVLMFAKKTFYWLSYSYIPMWTFNVQENLNIYQESHLCHK